MRDFSTDHRWLSINTATVRKQRGEVWPLPQILDACAARGIRAVSPWRDQVAAAGLAATAAQIKALGLELSGYCRGGMFTHTDDASYRAMRDDNLRALDEACTLNAPCHVLVVGGLPGALAGKAAHRDIGQSREQVAEGIAWLLEEAKARRMPLAIEPLHPMYAADRACINTLSQALDVDPLNVFLVALTSFVARTTALFSLPYMRVERDHGKMTPPRMRLYHSMYQLFSFTMLLALLTNNMGILWVAMEGATLATVLLVSVYRTAASLEAAWKYFILCGVGIAQALFGTILLYLAAERVLV